MTEFNKKVDLNEVSKFLYENDNYLILCHAFTSVP